MKAIIFGGTGSLGKALVSRLTEVVVVSRDELKHKQMTDEFPHVEFVLGDVRDSSTVDDIINTHKPTHVFCFAALKHVDYCERFPLEAIKTNFLGAVNVCRAAKRHRAQCYLTSTDKAVDPINVYGCSKLLAEKHYLLEHSTVFRWGNVLGSRGSVLPLFVHQLRNNKPVTITDKKMTRFFITLDDVVDYMLKVMNTEIHGLHIPTMKACKITDLASAVAHILNEEIKFQVVGKRPGEKIHEKLSDDLYSNKSEQFTFDELCAYIKPVVQDFVWEPL